MRTCRDPQCEHYGTTLPDEAFGRNAYYDTRGAKDGRSIYCRACSMRRTAAYRQRLKEIPLRSRIKIPLIQLCSLKGEI